MAVERLAYSTSAQMRLTGYCSRNAALDRPLGDKESGDQMIEQHSLQKQKWFSVPYILLEQNTVPREVAAL